MAAILEAVRYEVLEAGSGAEALGIVCERPVVVVLLDVQMPTMDGYEVARRLRADPRTQPVPIIFVTAVFLVPSETQDGYLRGEDYAPKPVDADVLLGTVAAYSSRFTG